METNNLWPIYELTSIAPKNINELILQIEFNFLAHLKALNIEESQKEKIKALLKSKWWLKNILNEVYKWRFNLESDKELDLQSLRKFLEDISEIWQEIIDNFPWFKNFQRSKSWSPLQIAWMYYFNDESITTQDMIIIETFFRSYLVNKYIVLSKEWERKNGEVLNAYYFSSMIQNQLLLYTIYAETILNISEAKEVTQLLLLLVKNSSKLSQKQIEDFWAWVEQIDFKEKSEKPTNKLLKLIKDIFPEIFSIEDTKYKVSAILLWEYSENDSKSFNFRLIPNDNFYFRKDEEIINEGDTFPEAGNMIYNYEDRIDWMKDICIFDTNWNKVFWWDVWEKDIKDIKWTYYILTQSEWWRDAPEFAQANIKALKPVVDPIWDTIRAIHPLNELGQKIWDSMWINMPNNITIPNDVPFLIPEYVRALAVWKIENWKYIKNPRKINL